MSYASIEIEPQSFRGVRVNHPTVLTYIRNAIIKGYGNEQICRIVGVPGEIVDKERAKLRQNKAT